MTTAYNHLPFVSGNRRPGAANSRCNHCNRCNHRAFSLVELMIAMAVLSIMLLFFATITETVSSTWSKSEARVETYQTGRGALELIAREMTPAVVDTRMQYVIMPGKILENECGAQLVAKNSPSALWIAPLGEQGGLRCLGYYLYRDDERGFYRLKRIFIAPNNDDGYFPRLFSREEGGEEIDIVDSEENVYTSPTDATWFYGRLGDTERRLWDDVMFDEDGPENEHVLATTVADGVLALWFQAIDRLGNPIRWVSESIVHPQPDTDVQRLIYNSAAFFQTASTLPFDTGLYQLSTVYLAGPTGGQAFSMKGNRVPAAVDITIITVDSQVLARRPEFPFQENIMLEDNPMTLLDEGGTLDVDASVKAFQDALAESNITTARTFTTRVKLVNGS